MTKEKLSKYKSILKEYWRYENFRPSQLSVLEHLVDNKNTLAVMPTGGGKSICYQVPALSFPGLCIVISPLIALMLDQVKGLSDRNIYAAALFGSLPKVEQEEIINNAIHNELQLLYISPERLTSKSFIKALPKMKVDFIAIDEAHCISQWGHDFRPAYRNINSLISLFPEALVLAVTATATPVVQDDILRSLKLENAERFLQASRRENLAYKVIETENKMGVLQSIILANEGACGIVYARSRKLVEKLTLFLKKRKIKAVAYHAGLSFGKKSKNQNDWFKGKQQVMVATNAFGMGIDKSDVRYVVHFDLAPNLEEYTQEAGRAGRDGAPSEAIILVDENDIESKKKDIEKSYPPLHLIKDVYKSVASKYNLAIGETMPIAKTFHLMDFCQKYGLPVLASFYALKILDKAGYIMLTDSFYHSSEIKVDKEQLDIVNLNLGNPLAHELLNKILRIYDGIFYKQVKIDESYLATKITATIEETKEALKYLNKNGVLKYTEGGNNPKIKIRGPRRHSDSINISPEVYSKRKEDAFRKLDLLQKYLNADSCRQIVIDAYFGFENSAPCRICDLCRSKFDIMLDDKFLENKVISLLKQDVTDINQLLQNFTAIEKKELVAILEKMESNKIISIISNQVILER